MSSREAREMDGNATPSELIYRESQNVAAAEYVVGRSPVANLRSHVITFPTVVKCPRKGVARRIRNPVGVDLRP